MRMRAPRKSISFWLAAAASALLVAGQAKAQGDFWQKAADMPTPRRLLAAAAGEDGNIYTFGGCGSPCFEPPLHTSVLEETRVEVYDPRNDSWTVKRPMPTILFGAAAAAPGNSKIYTFGGYLSANVVQEYDPAADSWVLKQPMPTPRYGLAAVALEGKIYTLGGSGPSNALEVYDPATDSWSRKAPMPTARVFLAAAVAGGKIYAVGGSPDCCGGSQTAAVEVYDPATDSWAGAAPLPAARQVSAAAGANGKLYVFGGFVPGSGAKADTFEYDPATNAWASRAPMPVARDQAPAVVTGQGIFVLGGSVDCHCQARGDNHRYVPPQTPLRISKREDRGLPVAAPGETLTYRIVVSNDNPIPVPATVTDELTASGLSDVAWCKGPSCPPSPSTAIVDMVTVPANGAISYTATGTVPCNCKITELANTACVAAAGFPSVCASDSKRIAPAPAADLRIVKQGPPVVVVPSQFSYTLTIENRGPCPTSGVIVTDPVPPGLDLVAAPACGASSPCTLGPGEVKVTASAFRVPKTHPCSSGDGAVSIISTATVTGACPDLDATNNSSTVETPVSCGTVSPSPAGVPGLSAPGIAILALLLAAVAVLRMRRGSHPAG